MTGALLFVGSIPLETAEEVMRTFGRSLGTWLDYLPDGEVGDRRYWIDGIAYRVLNGHPEIETLQRPAPDERGVENWRPRGSDDQFKFRVKPGVDRVRFGDPGWRLGYTRDAISSYFVFRQLRKDGVIPPHVRFQVSLPSTYSAVTVFFPDPADHPRIVPGFTTALADEVTKMAEKIPPDDLAIQWDLAIENRRVEAALLEDGADAAVLEARRVTEPLRLINARLPEGVALGYHSCFGTLSGWPSRRPHDLRGSVILLNEAVTSSGREAAYVHFPTLGSDDETFFAPLSDLNVGGARVYVGAIHHMHGAGGLSSQLNVVRKYLQASDWPPRAVSVARLSGLVACFAMRARNHRLN
jgi:hypothetical protein